MELKINRMLKEKKTPEQIAKKLIKELQKGSSTKERFSVLSFLLNSHLYSQVIEIINEQISSEKTIYWSYYLEALNGLRVKIKDESLESFINFSSSQNQEAELLRSFAFDKKSSSILKFRNKYEQNIFEEKSNRKDELLEKIEFYKSQRIIQEEKKALEELKLLYPNDKTITPLEKSFSTRWGKHIFTSTDDSGALQRTTKKIKDQWRKDNEIIFKPISESAIFFVKKYPKMSHDLALMAYFMEFYEEALEIIKFAPKTPARDWFILELLLETNRFVDVLELADSLEQSYQNDADSTFATTLAKSKAFWGLKQKKIAIELITSIINIRPNYRSASSLLEQWTGA